MRIALPLALLVACGPGDDPRLSLVQGSDAWSQAPNNEVDILFVVDDSGSMAEEQAQLATGFSTFANQLEDSGTDFHLAVVPTTLDFEDPDAGELVGDPPFLTGDDDYVTLFGERAQLGVGGADQEQGLGSALWTLELQARISGDTGFFRPLAHLMVVVVSDEEDCSHGGTLLGQAGAECYLQPEALTPVPDLVEDLFSLKPERSMVQLGAIVGTEGSSCDTFPGRRYMEAAARTGGLIGDICDGDWSAVLSDMGVQGTGIRQRFQTSHLAIPESLVVTVDDLEVAPGEVDGWTYDADGWWLVFHGAAVPERGAEIVARYDIQPGSAQTPP